MQHRHRLVWRVQTYKAHERSRESIEMAFDTILQEKMKVRHKQGFKPPKRGRKTDLEGDAPVRDAHDIMQWFRVSVMRKGRPLQHRLWYCRAGSATCSVLTKAVCLGRCGSGTMQ